MPDPIEEVKKRMRDAGLPVVEKPQPNPPPPQPDLSGYEEFIPVNPNLKPEQLKFREESDAVIKSIDILDYYRMFCGKMIPRVGRNQRDSIMISCPIPGHADKTPSAWINLDKQTWYCGACTQGGDGLDIAAFYFGMPVPGYKQGKSFHELRKQILEHLNYTVVRPLGARYDVLVPPGGDFPQVNGSGPHQHPADEQSPPGGVAVSSGDGGPAAATAPTVAADTPNPPPQPGSSTGAATIPPLAFTAPALASVTPLMTSNTPVISDDPDANFNYPTIDWQNIFPPGTFAHEFCTVTAEDDIPEEYNFWNALTAIGLALDRTTTLHDKIPVYGNLYVCTIGASGAGKSQATGHLRNLLKAALPFNWDDPITRGAVRVPVCSSGEILVDQFSRMLAMNAAVPNSKTRFPVTGWMEYPELSDLAVRKDRTGSTLGSTLMNFYDMRSEVTTVSRNSAASIAEHPFLSITTTTQLKSIRNLMKESDAASGTLNRWIFSMGPAKRRVLFGGVTIDITPAVDPLQEILTWSQGVPHIFLPTSSQACKVALDFWDSVGRPLKERSDNDMYSRLDLLYKKLILLFAANKLEQYVSVETVESVAKLFPYIPKCIDAIYQRIATSKDNELTTKIINKIEELEKRNPPEYVSSSDLYQLYKNGNNGVTLNEIRRQLETLVSMDILEPFLPNKGKAGRPTTRYKRSA